MFAIEQKRRSFLLGLGSIGISQLVMQASPGSGRRATRYVPGPTEGEHLVHFSRPCNIYISRSAPRQAPTVSPWDPASDARLGHTDPPTSPDGRSLLRPRRQRSSHAKMMYRTLLRRVERYSSSEHLAWVFESRSRTALALNYGAGWPRRLFP